MTTRVVEGKKPYTGGKAITVDENKVISLRLRDENNLIIYDAGDNEIYVDLQLPDELTPTDAFPVGITTGRVIVDNGWDLQGTLICAKTTSGDNIKLLYADEGTLWIDNGTGTFKQIYFKGDVDSIVQAIYTYINQNANVKAFLIYGTEAQKKQKLGDAINYYVVSGKIPLLSMDSVTYTLISAVRGDGEGNTDDVYTFSSAVNSDTGKYKEVKVNVNSTTPISTTVDSYTVTEHSAGGGGGSGDVVGPSSATDGHLAVFDGATGKLIKDGGAIPPGVPAVGTNGQVLTVVSGAAAWATPSGGDVMVSSQANNLLTAGMKIWCGTEGDYTNLGTYDSNSLYLTVPGGATPGGWQPGADTIAYFPMDSDLLDHSGNSFSVTTYGNVSIGTAGGVSAGDFSSVGELGGSVVTTGSLTVLGYAYKTANPTNDNASMFGFGGGNMGGPLCQALYWNTNGDSHISNKPGVALFDWDTQANQTAVSMNNNEWVHFAVTFDWSTKVVKLYTNGVLSSQYTTSATYHPDYLGVSRANGINRSWIGYLSEVIFESKCWTDTEISDYFDQTKGDYGIS